MGVGVGDGHRIQITYIPVTVVDFNHPRTQAVHEKQPGYLKTASQQIQSKNQNQNETKHKTLCRPIKSESLVWV